MSSGMMDTVPGGETPQYESIKTVTKPTEKSEGQLGDASDVAAERSQDPAKLEKGEKIADNVSNGQKAGELGMGGMTKGMDGKAQQDGYGGVEAKKEDEELEDSRREQKYGGMPNIGA